MSTFRSDVIARNGDPGYERVLLEVAFRFADANEFTLTPRQAAEIIAQVLRDLEEAREHARRLAAAEAEKESSNG